MTNLVRYLARRPAERADPQVPFQQWTDFMLNYGGLSYAPSPNFTLGGHKQEEIAADFMGYVHGAYRSNGIIFALVITRMLLLSEARFQWRRFENGRPTDFFGTEALKRLEKPYGEGSTTRNLICDMSTDADLAGNFYAAYERERFWRLRPDWVTVILGSRSEVARTEFESERDPSIAWDAEIVGYVYHPGGRNSGKPPKAFLPSQVIHYAPYPSKLSNHLGMSWIQSVVQETMADKAAMTHKQMFFENGATPNLVVSLHESITDPKVFNQWIEAFEAEHGGGLMDAYRTIYLGAGADATVVGSDLHQIDFKVTQGHGETRLAAAARMPAILVGIIAGLEAATYSNYGMARRAAADMTLRPTWGMMAGACSRVVPLPPPPPGAQQNAELWYDVRDVSFLQEDAKDDAEIQEIKARTMNVLIMAGFEPDAVVDAVTAFDLERLERKHTGLVSVQMHKPGEASAESNGASANGNGSGNLTNVPVPNQ